MTVAIELTDDRRMSALQRLHATWLQLRRRLLKTALGVGALGLALHLANRMFIQTISVDAVVSAGVVNLAAPIDGFVKYEGVRVGGAYAEGSMLGRIDNPLFDTSKLVATRARKVELDGALAAANELLSELAQLGTNFDRRSQRYTSLRHDVFQLEIQQARAELSAREAQAEDARLRLARVEQLTSSGVSSVGDLDAARRDARVNEEGASAMRKQVETLETQARSIKDGMLITQAAQSDRPYSGQRVDELSISAAQLRSRRNQLTSELGAVREELQQLEAIAVRRQNYELRSPERSIVSEILSTAGEYVGEGQPLLRLTNCSDIFVTAYVKERSFNRLRPGDLAEISVVGSSEVFDGTVEALLGSPESQLGGSRTAFLGAEQRARFAVRVGSHQLRKRFGDECIVGRAVEVHFKSKGG
jgi:multidrug resistance efflux pump